MALSPHGIISHGRAEFTLRASKMRFARWFERSTVLAGIAGFFLGVLPAQAQRTISAGSILLDDGQTPVHSILIQTPPGLTSTTPYTFYLPTPPPGPGTPPPTGYVVAGSAVGQTLYWNGSVWQPSSLLYNTAGVGLGFGAPPALALPFAVTTATSAGPYTDNNLNLGDPTHRFNTIYVSNIVGPALGGSGWGLNGNDISAIPSSFVGTTTNNALELHVFESDAAGKGSKRVMRFEPNASSANIIGGFQGNFVTGGVFAATIAGGGVVSNGNSVTGNGGTVGGGISNSAALSGTVGGGVGNAVGTYSTISGGSFNTAASYCAIPGGSSLALNGNYDFGFQANTVVGGSMSIAASQVAVFSNVNMWLANNDNVPRELRFYSNNATTGAFPPAGLHYTSLHAATGMSGDVTFTLPSTTGSLNQVLTTDGTGVLSWSAPGSGSGWGLTGNTGTTSGTNFIGTTDNKAVEIHVFESDANFHGSKRVVRYEPTASSPNILAGYQANIGGVGKVGLTISGGGASGQENAATNDYATVAGGLINTASGSGSVVGGGQNNSASNVQATVAGGVNNNATNTQSTIAGGRNNTASGDASTISGGSLNFATGPRTSVGGGVSNTAGGSGAVVSGGGSNIASGDFTAIAGGQGLTLSGQGSFGFNGNAGGPNSMSISATNTALFGNVDLWIGNNDGTFANSARQLRLYSVYGTNGAYPNGTHFTAFRAPQALGSDLIYTMPSVAPTVNQVLSSDASGNLSWATAASGWGLTGNAGTTAGTNFIGTTDNQALEIHVWETSGAFFGAKRVMRYEPNATSANLIGGYFTNSVSATMVGATIAGGGSGTAANSVTGSYGSVLGGTGNSSAGFASVGGGSVNHAGGGYATIAGGQSNTANVDHSVVGGGFGNAGSGSYSTIGGGNGNTVSGNYDAIPGGNGLTLSGDNSFGFLGNAGGTNTMSVAATSTAIFGNVDLWLGNNDGTTGASARQLRFYAPYGTNGAFPGTNYTAFRSPAALAASITYTLPSVAPTASQVLSSDGSGNLSWATAAVSGWGLTGNAGTTAGTNFIGTTDNKALEIHIFDGDGANNGSKRVMRYEPNATSANIIGGYQANSITGGVTGATIAGGGYNTFANSVTGSNGTVGGGAGNTAGSFGTVAGGAGNSAGANSATVGGGSSNFASVAYATVAGGSGNSVSGIGSTVAGGSANFANGGNCAIPGGSSLALSAANCFGFNANPTGLFAMTVNTANTATFANCDLWIANNDNVASSLLFYAPNTTLGTFPGATKFVGFKAGAVTTSVTWILPLADGTIGQALTTNGSGVLGWSSAGAGLTNFTDALSTAAPNATVPVASLTATNAATDVDAAFVAKGAGATTAQVANNLATGGNKRGIYAVDWQKSRSANTQVASAPYSVVAGGQNNTASRNSTFNAGYSTVGGGSGNVANGDYSTVAGGHNNTADLGNLGRSTVGGGENNNAANSYATISGGGGNIANGFYSSIDGGISNEADGDFTTIAGGSGLQFGFAAQSCFGFLGNNVGQTHNATVNTANVAFLGNVNLWLGNNDNTAHALRFYSTNATSSGAFPPAGLHFTGFNAASGMSADITYTLPATAATAGQVLSSDGSSNLSWTNTLSSASGGTALSIGTSGATGYAVLGSKLTTSATSGTLTNGYSLYVLTTTPTGAYTIPGVAVSGKRVEIVNTSGGSASININGGTYTINTLRACSFVSDGTNWYPEAN